MTLRTEHSTFVVPPATTLHTIPVIGVSRSAMSDNENIPSIPSRSWTEAKAELIRLFREGEVDYYKTKAGEIKEVHTEHFSDQKLSNFYTNFRRVAKSFANGVRKDGARREAAGEEGMLLYFINMMRGLNNTLC